AEDEHGYLVAVPPPESVLALEVGEVRVEELPHRGGGHRAGILGQIERECTRRRARAFERPAGRRVFLARTCRRARARPQRMPSCPTRTRRGTAGGGSPCPAPPRGPPRSRASSCRREAPWTCATTCPSTRGSGRCSSRRCGAAIASCCWSRIRWG